MIGTSNKHENNNQGNYCRSNSFYYYAGDKTFRVDG
jgi:hypothetical protein